ncbi:alanine racemase [Corynebacterium mendelii]|uniref:Alanine racemase n=1 Tax=Corynebacterium mendelii TaxID=2765362 RepID=A0A939IVA9_9CORY|nr:alanine racemase [Corynebacterium mendelii]MBN9644046.1 alanine racemase [Corynebacterium mendelii]
MDLLEQRIDLDAIAHNVRTVKKVAAPAKLMCVVKADAYNHGAVECARVMAANGADQFGVATLDEAFALRGAGIDKPILAWIWRPEQDIVRAIEMGIDLGVSSPPHARAVVTATKMASLKARVSVKVETGLGRSGVVEDEWLAVFRMLAGAGSRIDVTGIFSHLALGDRPEHPFNDIQVSAFRRALQAARSAGLHPTVNHLANSPGTLSRTDLFFDMVRPGLVLYGLEPLDGSTHELIPAMSLVARITVVKPIRAGAPVSYGGTWTAPEDGYTAVVAAGYADGIMRRWQDHMDVSIGGYRYPQVGRVCMDQFVIWLGENKHAVSAGAEAVIFGPGTNGEMTATELAERTQTINYEIICSPHGRVKRTFTGTGEG